MISTILPEPQYAGIVALIESGVADKTTQFLLLTVTWILERSVIKLLPLIVRTVFLGPVKTPKGVVTPVITGDTGVGVSTFFLQDKTKVDNR